MPEEKLALGQILGHLSKDHHQTKHSDHILTHRLYQCWKLDPYLGQLARDSGLHSAINNQISFPTLKRLDEIRSKLSQTINSRMVAEGSGEDLNTNADNQALIRFIIASGFYPDVALYKGKRNSYQLGKLRHVNLATSSINYELALQNIRKAGITKPLALLARKQPPRPIYYVYEDLLDIGIKLLMRTTAVDPMVFALLAFDLQVKENSLLVDRWLTIKSDSAMDLRVLNETRLHLGNFLQWSISKRLAKQDLDPEERQLQDTFIDALLGLLSNSDINRPRLLKA